MSADEARERRLAFNEAIARDINTEVDRLAQRLEGAVDEIELICECSRDTCAERIHVRIADYREVRTVPQRFLLVEAHMDPEIERRVGTAGDATIVEKVGPGRAVAEETA